MFINRKQIIERLMCSPLTSLIPENFRDGIRDLIEKAPAVDAVEVVRCEKCRYYENGECVCDSLYFDAMSGDYEGVSFRPYPDFYCYYGERKESNND